MVSGRRFAKSTQRQSEHPTYHLRSQALWIPVGQPKRSIESGANVLRFDRDCRMPAVDNRCCATRALQWKGVAELIARGLSSLPPSAIVSVIIAAAFAAFIEIMTIIRKKPFPLSSVSIGLGVILPPDACFAMWIGALVFWWQGRRYAKPGTTGHRLWVGGAEPICAGLISGAALLGIANALFNVLFF